MVADDLVQDALQSLGVAVFFKDRYGRYALINACGRAVLGRSETEILGNDDFAFFDAASARVMRARDAQIALTPEPVLYESRAKRRGSKQQDLFRSAKLALGAGAGLYKGGLLGLSVLCVPGEEKFESEVPALLLELLKRRVPALIQILRGSRLGAGSGMIL